MLMKTFRSKQLTQLGQEQYQQQSFTTTYIESYLKNHLITEH